MLIALLYFQQSERNFLQDNNNRAAGTWWKLLEVFFSWLAFAIQPYKLGQNTISFFSAHS